MSASAGVNASISGAPALSFHNDGIYIRVENANTQTSAYFLKANLAMHCDNATSFMLKNDKLTTHYLFADVVKPSASDAKSLLEIFQSWIEESDATREDGPFVSDTTTTVIEVKTFYDKDPMRIDELIASGGSTTFDAGRNSVAMAITTATSARAVRQTKAHARLSTNKMMYAIASGVLVSSVAARNVFARIGAFDQGSDQAAGNRPLLGNGLFFEWKSGEGLSLVLRSNITGTQVDTIIPQASWNVDALDGTGASSKILDPTAEQTYVFEWSAIKGQVMRAGILQDGRPIFCHKFLNTRMGSASVPLRWEIGRVNTSLAIADNDAATMYQGAGSIMIQGNDDVPWQMFSATNTIVKAVTAANSPQPLLTLGLALNISCRARIELRRMNIINFDQGVAKWSLVLNQRNDAGTVLGPDVTTIVNPGNSFAMYNETANTYNGAGQVLASGYIGEGMHVIDLADKSYGISGTINGHGDILSLILTYVRGVVTATAAFDWIEYE